MVSKYMDSAIAGRDYDTTTGMIAKNEAVFMIMGDWQIGISPRPGSSKARITSAPRRRRTGASQAHP